VTEVDPLAGYTIGVTAARRADELAALLVRRGASVLHAPAIRIVPLLDDAQLRDDTEQLMTRPVDIVVVTTAIGFRGWIEAADGWGLGEDLIKHLGDAQVMARGPKVRGAVRAAGLTETWAPVSESNAELLAHLLERGVAGKRVAVQLHGEPLPDFVNALRDAGADVTEVSVYRWTAPPDTNPLDRLLDAIVGRQVDALAFTSAPAVASTLARAKATGRREAVVSALRKDILVACVGSICAGPFTPFQVPCVIPDRARIGALARSLAVEVPARAQRISFATTEVQVRGQAVIVDGELRPIAPAPMSVLRALAEEPGHVVSRQRLMSVLQRDSTPVQEHAVETAVGRLRTALGQPRLVQTVVKRGYRLALEA
jgi:uroporphyrinogen-III synthase